MYIKCILAYHPHPHDIKFYFPLLGQSLFLVLYELYKLCRESK